MRRFNLDELIWFILLLLLTSLWAYLIFSGAIYGLVNPRMVKYNYFAFAFFITLTIFQTMKIFTFPCRIDMSNKFIPLIFTLFMSVAYIAINSTYTNNSSILLSESEVIFEYDKPFISIENDNNMHYLIKDLNIDSNYIGETISLCGYIDTNGHLDENTFLISRDEISCCLQDLNTISILCKGNKINIKTIKNGTWVKAIGTLLIDSDGNSYLQVIELKEIKEPEKKYYSPMQH